MIFYQIIIDQIYFIISIVYIKFEWVKYKLKSCNFFIWKGILSKSQYHASLHPEYTLAYFLSILVKPES